MIVKDFQSIQHADVELGRFTVLVGQSSSGKSAFLRSVRALIRNKFVPSNVRSGASKAEVSAVFDDTPVSATRGKSISSYSLGEEKYTKTGKTVPDAVQNFLQFPELEGLDPNFNFQFDKPFLLSEPGSKVASVLGTLTNVSTLHAAVREANRRKLSTEADVKATRKLLTAAQEHLTEFDTLPADVSRLEAVESLYEALQDMQSERNTLVTALRSIKDSKLALESVEVIEVPQADWGLMEEYCALSKALRSVRTAQLKLDSCTSEMNGLAEQIHALAEKYDTIDNICPTCGQTLPLGEPTCAQ